MSCPLRIVLVQPSHPGNIGAAARAMKTMGVSDLYLVQPERFPSKIATERASGAKGILENAVITDHLAEALVGCECVFGTSARERSLPWPISGPRECIDEIIAQPTRQSAIVFGRERTGLTNEELALCQRHVSIPTMADFSSLNLASAVQIMCYEYRMAMLKTGQANIEPLGPANVGDKNKDETATADEVAGFYQHLQSTLIALKFLSPEHPKLLMRRLQRLFNRATLEKKEINILRGVLSAVDKKMDKTVDKSKLK